MQVKKILKIKCCRGMDMQKEWKNTYGQNNKTTEKQHEFTKQWKERI
jgi:hypothetical protein